MGYYLRYIVTDTKPLTLDIIEAALRGMDPAYAITERTNPDSEYGVITYSNELFGAIELNVPGDRLFADEILEFRESFDDHSEIDVRAVLEALDNARMIVAVQAVWGEREAEAVLVRLDPLWDWLKLNYTGIMHADGEGFYTQDGLVPDLR